MENDARLFSLSRMANSAITHSLVRKRSRGRYHRKGPHSKGGAGNLNLMKIDWTVSRVHTRNEHMTACLKQGTTKVKPKPDVLNHCIAVERVLIRLQPPISDSKNASIIHDWSAICCVTQLVKCVLEFNSLLHNMRLVRNVKDGSSTERKKERKKERKLYPNVKES
jgi:hypothetical protein